MQLKQNCHEEQGKCQGISQCLESCHHVSDKLKALKVLKMTAVLESPGECCRKFLLVEVLHLLLPCYVIVIVSIETTVKRFRMNAIQLMPLHNE